MSENTKIEWCDHTFNPWEGCQKIGPGCDHCYAETRNARFSGGQAINWGPGAPRRRTSAANWKLPLKWNRQFELKQNAWRKFVASNPGMSDQQLLEAGFVMPKRPRVFCASLADVFDNAVSDDWRADLFDLIAATPNLDWLLLTKRIGNVEAMVPYEWTCPKRGWPVNVWLGATIVNQAEANRDIPKLLRVPAAKRFLSMEPLLGLVQIDVIELGGVSEIYPLVGTTRCEDFDGNPIPDIPALDWVIVGGESGPGARPKSPEWARSLRDQCQTASVPFLFKQWGEWLPMLGQAEGVPVRAKTTTPDGWVMGHAGKKAAGRLLDGVVHNGFTEI